MSHTTTKVCFVTEVDLTQTGGAVTTDQRMIHCLQRLAHINVVHLEKTRFKSMLAALPVFGYKILKSLSGHHEVYFCRSLFPCAILLLLRPFGHYRLIHNALSVPFPSREVYFLPHGSVESVVRYHLFRFLETNALPRADGIIVASPEYASPLADHGVKKDRIWVVPFSVENAFFEQPVKEKVGHTFIFCYAGRFHLYHVLVPLIQAFDLLTGKIADAELLLVGEGPSRPQVEKEIAERNLRGKVKSLGMVHHDAFPSFLSTVDCFVLMSRAPGLPIGILEAAAAAKPILTLKRRNDEPLSRYFHHGKEIYMLETCSPREIAGAMRILFEDSTLRRNLALGARRVAQHHFSEEAVIPELLKILS